MAETPTFGRYAEIPYEQMTPEQQEGYRSLIQTRGRLPGPNKIYVHNPKLAKVSGSGPGGRINRDDLVAYLAAQRGQAPSSAPATPPSVPQAAAPATTPSASGRELRPDEERVRLSRRR